MSTESEAPTGASKTSRHWLKIGAELEGGWDRPTQEIAHKCLGAEVRHDGSVEGTAALFHGEVVTRPHEDVKELIADIKKMYPEYLNDSCGFHLHVSFSAMDTTCLADPGFWKYFYDRWVAWGDKHRTAITGDTGDLFWRRLHGKPTGPQRKVYAKPEFIPGPQLAKKDKKLKYTALNFVSWHDYRTVECRLLPMFKSTTLAEAAVHELLSIYDTYLSTVGFKAIAIERKVTVDVDGVKEVFDLVTPTRAPLTHDTETEHSPVLVAPDITYAFDSAPEAIAYMRPFRDMVDEEIVH